MSAFAPFRVKLWDTTGTGRGRGTVKAIVEDAKDVGVSAYANQGGEMFMTLPWNHPQLSNITLPFQRHYEVTRYNPNTAVYDVVGGGLISDWEADANEVVVYGVDYLSLFDLSISAATTTYTSTLIGSIIASELSAAFSASNSATGFISRGSIDATSQTVTVLTSYQPRLQFVQQLVDIYQSDSSVRPIVFVSRSSPWTVNFDSNRGTDETALKFEYGGLINDFQYQAGFSNFATFGYSIGQKREGATVLFSTQSYASPTTYGRVERATVFLDVVNQAALDRKAKRFARTVGTPERAVSFSLRVQKLGPWEWGDFGDSIPVVISRGPVAVNGLYTVWGQEWIGKKDGSEDLFLSIAQKET